MTFWPSSPRSLTHHHPAEQPQVKASIDLSHRAYARPFKIDSRKEPRTPSQKVPPHPSFEDDEFGAPYSSSNNNQSCLAPEFLNSRNPSSISYIGIASRSRAATCATSMQESTVDLVGRLPIARQSAPISHQPAPAFEKTFDPHQQAQG